MNELDYEQLTLFQEDSRASRSPWLESKKVKGMTVTSGRKCSELSENLRRVGYSVRTYLESCELPPGTWYRTWSVKDMTSRCLIMKLRLSERRTDEKESRLLPTVTAEDAGRTGSVDAWKQYEESGRTTGYRLRNRAQNIENEDGQPKLWKTPVAADGANREFYHNSRGEPNLSGMVKMWPTPTTRDYKSPDTNPNSKRFMQKTELNSAVALYPTPTTGAGLCGGTGNFQQLQTLKEQDVITEEERRNMSQGNGGQLNPDWVSRMMGYPDGWLDV